MARKIAVEIVGDSSSLEKAFKRSAKSAQQFNTDVGKAGKGKRMFAGMGKQVAGLTGLLGVGGLAGAAKAAFSEMGDAQKVAAQTAAALKSTKGAAGVTAGEIDKLATSLGNMSGVDDEAIASGENLLLTFTNIRNEAGKGNDIFNQTTAAMLDMAVAMGKDPKTAALQLGKALNDPVKGITALGRAGVQFTASQKKQIKALVESGKTLEAQKLILAELNKEFGGSAKAAGETLPGQLNKLRETALNLGGSIATLLTPQIEKTVQSMVTWLQNTQNQQAIMNTVKDVVGALSTAIGVLKTAFETLSAIVGGNRNAILLLIAAYAGFKTVQITSNVVALATSFGGLATKTGGATTATRGLSKAMIGKAGLVGAAGLASYQLTSMALKATGLDKKLRDLGASAYDAAAKIGLIKDPTAQFAGTSAPGQAASGKIRRQAAKLIAGGLTPQQAANVIAPRHPGFARHDIDVLAGVTGVAPRLQRGAHPTTPRSTLPTTGAAKPLLVNTVNVFGVQDPRAWEEHMTKRAKKRPHSRR